MSVNDSEDKQKKEETIKEILTEINNSLNSMRTDIDDIKEKQRHFDQFREDTQAQIETLSNMKSNPQLEKTGNTETTNNRPSMSGDQLENIVKTAVDGIDKIGSLIMRLKNQSLADPLSELKYSVGDRIITKAINPRIQTEKINYDELISSAHG